MKSDTKVAKNSRFITNSDCPEARELYPPRNDLNILGEINFFYLSEYKLTIESVFV